MGTRRVRPSILPCEFNFWDRAEAGLQFLNALLALPVDTDKSDKRNRESHPFRIDRGLSRDASIDLLRLGLFQYRITEVDTRGQLHEFTNGTSTLRDLNFTYEALQWLKQIKERWSNRVKLIEPTFVYKHLWREGKRKNQPRVMYTPVLTFDPGSMLAPRQLSELPLNITEGELADINANRRQLAQLQVELQSQGFAPKPSGKGPHSRYSKALDRWLRCQDGEARKILKALLYVHAMEKLGPLGIDGQTIQALEVSKTKTEAEESPAIDKAAHLGNQQGPPSQENAEQKRSEVGYLGISLDRDRSIVQRNGFPGTLKFKGRLQWRLFTILTEKKDTWCEYNDLYLAWKVGDGNTEDTESDEGPDRLKQAISKLRQTIKSLGLGIDNNERVGYMLVSLPSNGQATE